MARPARIEYEGAFYHVMNRGNRREAIFIDNQDRIRFYEIIGSIESRYKIIVYSYVLMSNHYHLIIELVQQTLIKKRSNVKKPRYDPILAKLRNLRFKRLFRHIHQTSPVQHPDVKKRADNMILSG